MTKGTTLAVLVLVFLFSGCASDTPTPPTVGGTPVGSNQVGSGVADPSQENQELKVLTGASQEGDVTNVSADVRNQEDDQDTMTGPIQTIGFAGAAGVADVISKDFMMKTLYTEAEQLLAADPVDTVRLDVVRGLMIAQSERLLASVDKRSAAFQSLEIIIAIFSMENHVGHTAVPLTNEASASKAGAFEKALSTIGDALRSRKSEAPLE